MLETRFTVEDILKDKAYADTQNKTIFLLYQIPAVRTKICKQLRFQFILFKDTMQPYSNVAETAEATTAMKNTSVSTLFKTALHLPLGVPCSYINFCCLRPEYYKSVCYLKKQ